MASAGLLPLSGHRFMTLYVAEAKRAMAAVEKGRASGRARLPSTVPNRTIPLARSFLISSGPRQDDQSWAEPETASRCSSRSRCPLPQQGTDLRPAVQGDIADDAGDRGRSEASERTPGLSIVRKSRSSPETVAAKTTTLRPRCRQPKALRFADRWYLIKEPQLRIRRRRGQSMRQIHSAIGETTVQLWTATAKGSFHGPRRSII